MRYMLRLGGQKDTSQRELCSDADDDDGDVVEITRLFFDRDSQPDVYHTFA